MNTQILRSPALIFGAKESKLQARAQRIFDAAEIQIGGHQPWDIRVHDPRFYYSVLAGDSLAAGEAYIRTVGAVAMFEIRSGHHRAGDIVLFAPARQANP